MNVSEGKQRFIESWGTLAGNWGIPRAMGQVHAVLLISADSMTADDIVEILDISRSSVCIQLKELSEWGLIEKTCKGKEGCRREYFVAEKDLHKVMRQIIIQRKKKELEPMIQVLDELSAVEPKCPESECFCQVLHDLKAFSHKANSTLDAMIRAESSWFLKTMMKVVG